MFALIPAHARINASHTSIQFLSNLKVWRSPSLLSPRLAPALELILDRVCVIIEQLFTETLLLLTHFGEEFHDSCLSALTHFPNELDVFSSKHLFQQDQQLS